MAYYVINKNTNEINPNAITGEVALFETEQDFINAKQQWIIDNTIINEFETIAPNESDYEYIVATDIQKETYKQELLAYRLANDNRTSIVVNHKYNVNIEHTHRKDNIAVYLEGQINEELGIQPYMYVETTGDLLNEFLANEQVLADIQEKTKLEADKKTFENTVIEDINKQLAKFDFYNSKQIIAEGQERPTKSYIGLGFKETFDAIQTKLASKANPAFTSDPDMKLLFQTPYDLLKYVNEVFSKNNNKKNIVKQELISALRYNCDTREQFEVIKNYYSQKSVQDGDDIKDGYITVPPIDIAKYDIKIYDLPKKLIEGLVDITATEFKDII